MESSDSGQRTIVALAFATIYFVWGSTYLAIRIAIETLPPFTMAGTRFAVAGLVVLLFAFWRGRPMPTLRQWRSALVVGGLLMMGGNGMVTWAEQTVSSSVAALLITTVPLWMTFLDAVVYRGAKAGPLTWVGLILGFAGVATMVRPTGDELQQMPVMGMMALLFAAFSWANGSLLSRRLDLPPNPLVAVGAETVAGGLLLILLGLLRGEPQNLEWSAVSARSVLAMLYLSVFGSILAFTAYMYLLRRVAASAVGTYAFVNPIVAVFLGWAMAGEVVTPRILLAGGAIVVGVVIILLAWRKPRPIPKT